MTAQTNQKTVFVLRIAFVTVVLSGLVLGLRYARPVAAVTRTWDGGGATNNWSEAANWSGDIVPASGDQAVFDGSLGASSLKDCTIDAAGPQGTNISIGGITINNSYAGTITVSSGVTTTFSNNSSQATGTFNCGGGLVTFQAATFTLSGGSFNCSNSNIQFQTGGTLTLDGGTFNAPSGTLSFAVAGFNSSGDFNIASAATFNHNNGSVIFGNQFGSLNISGGSAGTRDFNNLTLATTSNFSIGVSDTARVLGTLTLSGGVFAQGTFEAPGNVIVTSSFRGGNGGALLRINGPATRTITLVPGLEDVMPPIELDAPNVTLNMNSPGEVKLYSLNLLQGVVNTGSANVGFGLSGSFRDSSQSGGTFNCGGGLIKFHNANFTLNGGSFNCANSNVEFRENGTLTLSGGTFNAPSGTLSFTVPGFNSSGNIDIASGATFNHNNGTVVFGNQFGNININGGAAGTRDFNNLTLATTSNFLIGVSDTVRVLGTLTLSGGVFAQGTFEAPGNVIVTSSFRGGNGGALLRINGPATRTITLVPGLEDVMPPIELDAPNVTLNMNSPGEVKLYSLNLLQGAVDTGSANVGFGLSGSFRNSSQAGGAFNCGGGLIKFHNANFTLNGGSFNCANSNVEFRENGTLSLNGGAFNAPSGTLSFLVPGFNSSGDLNIASAASFNHNNGTVIFGNQFGSININGGATGTKDFFNLIENTTTRLSVAAGDTARVLNNLSVNQGGVDGNYEVQGNVTIASPVSAESGSILFSGTANQTFTNNGGVNPTGNWTVNKSAGTVTLLSDLDLSNSNSLTLTNGTITTGTNKLNTGVKTITRTNGYVIGNLQRSFTATGSRTFDVGTANGYSPVTANVTALVQNPSSLTVSTTQGGHPNLNPAISLGRYWTIAETGNLTANLTFNYLDPTDINGTELDYRVVKIDSSVTFFTNAQIPINRPTNSFVVNAVTDFATWTLGTPQVLITPVNISLAVFATQTFAGFGGIAPYTFSIVPPNNSGATINSSTGLYTTGALANVQDTVRVTDSEGRFANAIVSVVPGPPHHLRFTQQPSNTVQNLNITPTVLVLVVDQGNNTIVGATNPITLSIGNNPASGLLAGTLTRNAVAGVATFSDLSINNFGDGYTLTANAGGLAAATSNAFNILGFHVVNTNDSGPGSLRQAITNANNTPGTQTITFNISGTPPFTISPITNLPTLTQPIIIDGTTQPLFSGTPIVEIRGQSVGSGQGLTLAGGNSVVRGLIITGWNEGIKLTSTGNTIRGNYIGVGANGNTDIGNLTGVRVDAGSNLIGGTIAADRNVISGNNGDGILIVAGSANVIRGNYIGTDASGLNNLNNTNRGIYIQFAGQGTIIGGTQPGEGNIVAFNGFRGIEIYNAERVSIRGNSIHTNNSLGIEVYPHGINPNDAGDVDTGSNGRQNYPTLGLVTPSATQTLFQATLNSKPNTTFTLDFYSIPACEGNGYGEGKVYLGSTPISTDSTNIGSVNVLLPVVVPLGHFVTATATDVDGNTSEFSQCRVAAPAPVSISGRILTNSNAPMSSLSVKLEGFSTKTTVTNSNGDYSFGDLIPGVAYSVTPSQPNYSFAPAVRSYSNLITNQTNQNFTGTKTKSTIAGALLQTSINTTVPVFGGVVRISDQFGFINRTVEANPVYVFTSLPPGQYTITPEKSGIVFSPSSLVVQLGLSDQAITFTGQSLAPLPGRFVFNYYGQPATMTADGSAPVRLLNQPAQTNGSGPFRESADFSPDGKLLAGRNFVSVLTVSNADGSNHRRLPVSQAQSTVDNYAFSPDGTKLVSLNGDSFKVINVDGTGLVDITLPTSANITVKYSPTWISNSRIAFAGRIGNGSTEILAINTNSTGFTQLTDEFLDSYSPVASPNGSKIAFLRNNNLRVMNSDGTGDTLISTQGRFVNGYTWSPDGTKIAFSRNQGTSTTSYEFVSVNSSNGSGPRIILSGTLLIDRPSWGPAYEFTTPTGTNVSVNTGFTSITFGGVTTAGTTTITPIPANQGPGSFQLFGGSMAFEISTTATFTPPINICLTVPTAVVNTQEMFDLIFLGHFENGTFVDITTSRNFATRTICGSANSLSPFALGANVNSNLPSISGLVQDTNGNPISDVFVELTGTEERTIQTDAFGSFNFINLTQGGNYNVKPQRSGYLFEEPGHDFVGATGENVIVFTGTAATFSISGKALDGNGNAIAGVSLELSGGLSGQTLTAADGSYSFSSLPASGEFSIFAAKPDVVFNPDFTTIGPLTADQTNVDFIGAVTTPTPATIQFTAASLSVGEGDQHLDVVVQRNGDSSGASTISFGTSDLAGSQLCDVVNGLASARCDYQTTLSTIGFAPGETSKSVRILVVDDVYFEGPETLTLSLTNPAGASLGAIPSTTVTIVDNDLTNGINPIVGAGFYVRQHYLDFLNREPDAGGLAFWTNEITSCGSDQSCIDVKRINVSAAFYLSIEFQETGYLVERIYKAAYGDGVGTSTLGGTHGIPVPVIRFSEFLTDTQQVGSGVIVGSPGWEQALESNKVAFTNEFVQRTRFTSALPLSLTAAQFVDQLNLNAGNVLSQLERDQLVSDLTSGTKTRAQVLRAVAEDADLNSAEFNRAFVLMQFFGYLRRNPNDQPDSDYTGYDFWLTKLNQFGGNFVDAEMVKAFILSGEYRHRFGP